MHHNLSAAAQAAAMAVSWVERNSSVAVELAEKQHDMIVDLTSAVRQAQSSWHNLQQRPTIGLFGASQAGKSYLVSSLAAGKGSRLQTTWDGETIDFIRHINPSGNNSEATGFVTRFTHVPHQTPRGFPVELSLLSELELVMILVNAFFQDINQADVKMNSNESYYLQHLDKCLSWVDKSASDATLSFRDFYVMDEDEAASNTLLPQQTGQADTSSDPFALYKIPGFTLEEARVLPNSGECNFLSASQVVELADFVEKNSAGKLLGIRDFKIFWHRLRQMLPFMPLEGRIQALSILWNDLPIFNETYRLLAQELLKIHGAAILYAPASAFITSQNGRFMQKENGTIMHITRLATMFSDNESLSCCYHDGYGQEQVVDLNVSRLAALSLELRFALESKGVLDECDVLDLPGARSRDVIQLQDVVDDCQNFDGQHITQAMQQRGTEFFRRGKVAFLFDRYARRQEIEQLLFCIGVNVQQDVTVVQATLTDWINNNVGDTPQKRANVYNPLTIVLTRYDEVFNRQLKNINGGLPIDITQEENIAINRILKCGWFEEWTPGRPFDRVLLARKPNLGEINPWLEQDPETGEELGIRESEQEFIAQIQERLLENQKFVSHIHNFKQALQDVLSLNDGGMSRIAEVIRSNMPNDKERTSRRTYRVCHTMRECIRQLSPFATFQAGLALEKARKDGIQLSLNLLQCNIFVPCFHLFRNLLELSELRLNTLYNQGFGTGSNVSRFVIAVMNEYQSNLSEMTRKDHIKLNAIAEQVALAYEQRRINLESDPESKTYFAFCYNQQEKRFKTQLELKDDVVGLFNHIASEISKTFSSSQVGIQQYMIERLSALENSNESLSDLMQIQVQTVSFILSDFNLYLGSNLLEAVKEQSNEVGAGVDLGTNQATMNNAYAMQGGDPSGMQGQQAQGYLNQQGAGGYLNQQGYAQPYANQPWAAGQEGMGQAYPNQGGYPNQGAGAYPNQGGYPNQGAGAYPNQSGYPNQGTGAYPNQGAGAYPNTQAYQPPYGAAQGYGGAHNQPYGQAYPGQMGFDGQGQLAQGYPNQQGYPQGAAQGNFNGQASANVPKATSNAPRTSVLGSYSGPRNCFKHQDDKVCFDPQQANCDILNFVCQVDESGLLPRLDARSAEYAFKFISDFCAVLIYMMCSINVLQNNKYQFSATENQLLCNLLAQMEKTEICQV